MTPDGYIRTDAAARLLGLSTKSISRIAHQQHWPHIRDGHALAYRLHDVRTAARRRQQPNPTSVPQPEG